MYNSYIVMMCHIYQKEMRMKKKSLIVLLVLIAVVASSGLYAASTFTLGSVNYYSWADLEEGNSNAYVPGVRAEFFLSDYLGVSADALIFDLSALYGYDVYLMNYFIDAVVRLPLGLIEPYAAIGPGYAQVITEYEESEVVDTGSFNIRLGADFNILEWLSLGTEINFVEDDIEAFFNNIGDMTEEEIKANSKVGITAKIKF